MEGLLVGFAEGDLVGVLVGLNVGCVVGKVVVTTYSVGKTDGIAVGYLEGL